MSQSTENDISSADSVVIRAITAYKNESEVASRDRRLQNLENHDVYHMKEDFTYKKKGQSKEFLPKQFMAVEQITSFAQQGLADLGSDWYTLDIEDGVTQPKIFPDEVKKVLDRQMKKAGFYTGLGDALKDGLLNGLMIFKVHGRWAINPKYTTTQAVSSSGKRIVKLMRSKGKSWELVIDIVSMKDFYPDPTGRGLYACEDIEMDLHDIKANVKSASNPDGIYDAAIVEQLSMGEYADYTKDAIAVRESGQNVTMSSYRHRILVTECWGNIIDDLGNVIHENVVCTLAKNKYLIQPPQANPFWHQQNPYVVAPIIRVPHAVYHKALMDAPSKLNRASNEIFNLTLDSGIMSVFGIKQLRPEWLSDPSTVDDGIAPGMTLEANTSCPPNGKVLERVDTSTSLTDGLQTLNTVNAEFQQASMTNDLRLGVLPSRQVKATEIVESSQSITGMLNGVAKNIELVGIQPVLEKCWMVCAQNADDFNTTEMQKLLGSQRAGVWSSLTPEERFAETVNGLTFEVFGLTSTLNKQKDFRRVTALLQTISGNEILVEAFAKKYSFDKLLTEIMKALDINVSKLTLDPGEQNQASIPPPQPGQLGQTPPGQTPNSQSQIPQVASDRAGPTGGASPIQPTKFPPSPASNGGNGQ